jgi:hypothetical protein
MECLIAGTLSANWLAAFPHWSEQNVGNDVQNQRHHIECKTQIHFHKVWGKEIPIGLNWILQVTLWAVVIRKEVNDRHIDSLHLAPKAGVQANVGGEENESDDSMNDAEAYSPSSSSVWLAAHARTEEKHEFKSENDAGDDHDDKHEGGDIAHLIRKSSEFSGWELVLAFLSERSIGSVVDFERVPSKFFWAEVVAWEPTLDPWK